MHKPERKYHGVEAAQGQLTKTGLHGRNMGLVSELPGDRRSDASPVPIRSGFLTEARRSGDGPVTHVMRIIGEREVHLQERIGRAVCSFIPEKGVISSWRGAFTEVTCPRCVEAVAMDAYMCNCGQTVPMPDRPEGRKTRATVACLRCGQRWEVRFSPRGVRIDCWPNPARLKSRLSA